MTETSADRVVKLADLVPGSQPKAQAPFVLSDAERHEIEHEMRHYPDSRAASIEALKIVQKHRGWVCDDAIPAIAEVIRISAADLEGVATFYSLIFRQPVGRNVIKVCDSISCHLTGYDELRDALIKQLGIKLGQTTPDDRFTLLPICCLGACDLGPTLLVNGDLHGPVDPADIGKMLEAYQ